MIGPGYKGDVGFTQWDDKATMLYIYQPAEVLCP